jgi:hypothetical protein
VAVQKGTPSRAPRRARGDIGESESRGSSAPRHCDRTRCFTCPGLPCRARERLRAPHRGGQSRSRRQRLRWADLLRRVFGIDVLVCPQCAGPRRVLAAIQDPAAIAQVLGAIGLTAAGADPAGRRAPPDAAGCDDADEGNAAE